MPVRNFYIRGTIDGQKTEVFGGPRTREGGLQLRITQRNGGDIDIAYDIDCYVNGYGNLVTSIKDGDGRLISRNITNR